MAISEIAQNFCFNSSQIMFHVVIVLPVFDLACLRLSSPGRLHDIWATVNIMDVRTIFKLDIGHAFYMGIVVRPLLKSLYRIHVVLANQ